MSMARRALLVLLLVLPVAGGCSVWQKVTGAIAPDAVEPPPSPFPRDLQFDDLPVPEGLTHDRERSFAYQHGTTRSALLRYHGNVSADDVVDFFRRELPRYQWELGLMLGEREKRKIQFEKVPEVCEITVELIQGITYVTMKVAHK